METAPSSRNPRTRVVRASSRIEYRLRRGRRRTPTEGPPASDFSSPVNFDSNRFSIVALRHSRPSQTLRTRALRVTFGTLGGAAVRFSGLVPAAASLARCRDAVLSLAAHPSSENSPSRGWSTPPWLVCAPCGRSSRGGLGPGGGCGRGNGGGSWRGTFARGGFVEGEKSRGSSRLPCFVAVSFRSRFARYCRAPFGFVSSQGFRFRVAVRFGSIFRTKDREKAMTSSEEGGDPV